MVSVIEYTLKCQEACDEYIEKMEKQGGNACKTCVEEQWSIIRSQIPPFNYYRAYDHLCNSCKINVQSE